ncbi:hypothetical protein AALP_AA6G271800 [Arabis alpina]|uniref:Uncharacterized protein n=1 Tax=Arabis alpina TaxID=50452 RepID=A0A087GS07_ARAAL|nr:hypothetical protein AALP_AA6G271800 [Arabis alpina]
MTSVNLPPMIVSSPPSSAMTINPELLNLVAGQWLSLPVSLSRSLPPKPPDPPDPPDSSRFDIDSLQRLLCDYCFSIQTVTTPPSHTTNSSPPLTGGKLHHCRFISISPIDLSGTRSRVISIISTGGGLQFQCSTASTVVSGSARLSSPEELSRRSDSTNHRMGEMVIMGFYDCKFLMGLSMSCTFKPNLDMEFSDFSGPLPLVPRYRFSKILYAFELKFSGFSNPVIYRCERLIPPSSISLRMVEFPSFKPGPSKSQWKVTIPRISGYAAKTLLTYLGHALDLPSILCDDLSALCFIAFQLCCSNFGGCLIRSLLSCTLLS